MHQLATSQNKHIAWEFLSWHGLLFQLSLLLPQMLKLESTEGVCHHQLSWHSGAPSTICTDNICVGWTLFDFGPHIFEAETPARVTSEFWFRFLQVITVTLLSCEWQPLSHNPHVTRPLLDRNTCMQTHMQKDTQMNKTLTNPTLKLRVKKLCWLALCDLFIAKMLQKWCARMW